MVKGRHTRPRASDAVAHGTTITPTGGKDLGVVDAQVVLDAVEDGIDKGNVLAAAVGPALVEPVGGDKDGRVACQGPQPVELPVGHVVHGPVAPVEAKHEPVCRLCVVARWQLQDVLSLAPVDRDGLCARGGSGFPTACRRCGQAGLHRAQQGETCG